MSAAMEIRTDIRGTDAISRRLEKMLRGVKYKEPLMDEIGGLMVASTINNFENSRSPDGVAWIHSVRALIEGGQTLINQGILVGSMTHLPSNDDVEWGSNLAYAGIHNDGGFAGRNKSTEMPKRTYLGISISDEFAIVETTEDYLQELMA